LDWTKKFIEVAKVAKEVENIQAEIDGFNQDLWNIDNDIDHVNACIEDLNLYGTEQMQEEHDKIAAIADRLQNDNKIKMIARQLRYTQFEKKYFSEINAYKKKSMDAQKQ
jgi:septal ring factor EnvC (AmiA/AmiB activator)